MLSGQLALGLIMARLTLLVRLRHILDFPRLIHP